MCCESFILKVEGWNLILFTYEDGCLCLCMPSLNISATLRIVKLSPSVLL